MKYDVIVIGAGHAGLEAAFGCARQNLKVGFITLDEKTVALTPCNPSIGGPAKGIVTREIDILGGMQALAADNTQLQMKMLNTSKGPGVWSLRAQIDKVEYHKWFLNEIKKNKNIDLIIDEVLELCVNNNTIKGVVTKKNKKIESKYVIITTGTYLKSLTYKGINPIDEGPDGLANSNYLSDSLKSLGLQLIRLKTGTPPRILKTSIDYSNMKIEPGTDEKLCFNHFNPIFLDYDKQLPCYIVYTNEKTHQIINDNLKKSAMYSGVIKSIGPRYCPSIEDKVVKFSDKPRHQIFVEPESKHLDTMYLGGFSTSMPIDVQEQMIRSLPGLEKCEIIKYAYAIEYDAIDPTQLYKTLETKNIKNLFFAGQINGTSGYEEAAAQGLIAAINVGCKEYNREPLILKRSESYIGVMIDDITTRGVSEPYRLLTSRAEHRLYLRNDNADERLIEISYKNNMVDKKDYDKFKEKMKFINEIIEELKIKTIGMFAPLRKETKKTNLSLYDYLKRPEKSLKDILDFLDVDKSLINDEIIKKIDIKIKFDGYIKKQEEEISKISKLYEYDLSFISDYKKIPNLSLEAIDKLNKIKPHDLDQASRISGINTSDIINIKYFLDKK